MAGAPSQSWTPDSQSWTPDSQSWTPDSQSWTPDSQSWTPDSQSWTPDSYKLQPPTQHRQSQASNRQMLSKLREMFKEEEIETVLIEVTNTPIVDKSSLEMQKKNVKKIQDKFRLLFRAITVLAGTLGFANVLVNLNKIRSSLDDGSPVVLAKEENGQIHVIVNKIPEFCKNSSSFSDEFAFCLSELDKLVT